ncbi:MAG: NAD-dependent epimerase/dehydratase family protein, partial [Chromatocurvus sp.]
AGKAAAELFLEVFHHQHGNLVTLLRPANLYGPGQPLRARFGVIPAVLYALARGTAFTCYGDGEQVRDFLYIEDAVDLMLRAGRVEPDESAGEDGAGIEIYNLGSGAGVCLNTLMTTAESVTGRVLRRENVVARAADLRASILDCRQVRARFGWTPATSLESGLRQTWQALPDNP